VSGGSPIRRAVLYVGIAVTLHIAWETAQLPLYTIWWTGTAHQDLVAVVHCTGGDALITTATLLIATLIGRFRGWPSFGSRVALTTIVLGIAYTILSEWLNVEVWRSWSYGSWMPVLPWFGTGIAPLLQWLVVPAVAFVVVSVSRTTKRPVKRPRGT
jgi:hypothetical protein